MIHIILHSLSYLLAPCIPYQRETLAANDKSYMKKSIRLISFYTEYKLYDDHRMTTTMYRP